jgi:hypothetical protein
MEEYETLRREDHERDRGLDRRRGERSVQRNGAQIFADSELQWHRSDVTSDGGIGNGSRADVEPHDALDTSPAGIRAPGGLTSTNHQPTYRRHAITGTRTNVICSLNVAADE